MKTQNLIKMTFWANRLVALLVGSLIFSLPGLTLWYCGLLGFTPPLRDFWAVMICFYFCTVAIFAALWNMEKLLKNLLRAEVFTRDNVKRIRNIQWCCGIVTLISLVASIFAGCMLVIVAIMGFLCLVVGVVASVLDAAVALQEENDLTI